MATDIQKVPSGYKQTEIGIIPVDWDVRPLLTAVHIAKGQVDPKQEPYMSMVLVAPDHIERGTGRLLNKETAAEQKAISGKYVFERGDIVYSKIRPYLRKAVLVNFDGLCSADMYPLKPAVDVSGRFMLAIILGHRFSKYAESVSIRSGMPKINREELAEYSFALPPLSEQTAVASVLFDVDALIEKLETLIEKKKNIKQGAMQELLTGKRRLPGFKRTWEKTTIQALTERIIGGGTPSRANPLYWGGKIPWVTVKDFASFNPLSSQETITEEGLKRSASHLIPGGILIIATRIALGNAVIYEVDVAINQDLKALFFTQKTDSRFMYYWFQANAKMIKELGSGSTVMGISLSDLRNVEILKPELEEQIGIVAVLSDMDIEIQELESQLTKYRNLKQGMMQVLLTGKIRLI